jgi:uncharacterized protein (TIGR03086 family)
MDVLDLQALAAAVAQRVIDGVRPEQLSLPTPCSEWDVRALLNHMVGGNMMAVARAAGEPAPDFDADFVGADAAAAFATSASAADAALRAPGVMERTVQMRFGEVTGRTLAAMRFVDLLIHTWDLARATGQMADLDPQLCEIALTLSRERFGDRPRQPGGAFAPEIAIAADAPVCDRLAAYLGRQP